MNTTSLEATHAPSHLREQFQQWLDSYEPNRLHEMDIRPVESLLDALANCCDVLPADYCDQLEIPKGSTYAQAVADVRQRCASKQGQPATEPALESLDEDNDLRERVFQLICDHWVDEAEYDAKQALGEAIHDGIVPVSDLLRPLIEGESGFWLEQMARTCFHLPNRDFEGADWAGLLEEIEDKAKLGEDN